MTLRKQTETRTVADVLDMSDSGLMLAGYERAVHCILCYFAEWKLSSAFLVSFGGVEAVLCISGVICRRGVLGRRNDPAWRSEAVRYSVIYDVTVDGSPEGCRDTGHLGDAKLTP